jgi:hypothetical protein
MRFPHFHAPTFSTRGRITLAVIVAALLVAALAAYAFIPPVRNYVGGPSPDAVAAQRNLARADDLAAQNKQLQARLNASASKSAKEVADLSAALKDNQKQLADANAKLSTPDPNAAKAAQAGVAQARADSLKGQLDAAQTDADAKLAAKSAAAGEAQARADDLKRQIDALQYVPPVVASLNKQGIVAARKQFGLFTQQSPFSYAEFDQTEAAFNRDMQVSGYFGDWAHDFRPDAVQAAWSRNQIPLLTWESQETVGIVTADQSKYSLPNIYGGKFDDYIRKYARDVKTTNLPLIIRLDQEMNLGRGAYPWSEVSGWDDKPINGNSRGDYVKMWRHVVDIFREEGAGDLVAWMWAPNRINRIPSQPLPAAFWPGADYVDLIGMDAYLRPTDAKDPATFEGVYGETLPYLRELSGGKIPLWIAETGATDTGGRKVDFINDLFAALSLPENVDIAGVMNFALTVTSNQGTNNWSFTSTAPVVRAAADGFASSGWGRQRG